MPILGPLTFMEAGRQIPPVSGDVRARIWAGIQDRPRRWRGWGGRRPRVRGPEVGPIALPTVERRTVSVTRDDDPVHTRATVEAPPPSSEVPRRKPPASSPREPTWAEKRATQLLAEGYSPAEAREMAEREGHLANAPPGAARERDTLTPTQPSAPTLDRRIERLWHAKIEAALLAGKNARHCHGARCFQQGQDISACECRCDSCALVVDLLIRRAPRSSATTGKRALSLA